MMPRSIVSPFLVTFILSALVIPDAFVGLYPGSTFFSLFFFNNLLAVFSKSLEDVLVLVTSAPDFLAAARACAAFFLSAFTLSA